MDITYLYIPIPETKKESRIIQSLLQNSLDRNPARSYLKRRELKVNSTYALTQMNVMNEADFLVLLKIAW